MLGVMNEAAPDPAVPENGQDGYRQSVCRAARSRPTHLLVGLLRLLDDVEQAAKNGCVTGDACPRAQTMTVLGARAGAYATALRKVTPCLDEGRVSNDGGRRI